MNQSAPWLRLAFILSSFASLHLTTLHAAIPPELRPWLESPQQWERDTDGPIVSLGDKGSFDDTHIFAPAVAFENGEYKLWHCGSTSDVANRVFKLGLSTSADGRDFTPHPASPVYDFGNGTNSILTPTLLRHPNGATMRENGNLRMWFSSTSFKDKSGLHTLHEATSADGVTWSKPSPALLKHVYAPTVIKTGRFYQMWYTDVSGSPWIMRHAASEDGTKWRVTHEPVVGIDQNWEKQNLFYPTVIKIGDAYLMWYGSYWTGRRNTTALGLAASLDGLKWYKHPDNPVYKPDPNRAWESHYTTSQSIMQLPDGSLRIWYASRKQPPFNNKYFAINTAIWKKPPIAASPSHSQITDRKKARPSPSPSEISNLKSRIAPTPATFRAWQSDTRAKLSDAIGIPKERVPLNAEKRGQFEWDGIIIEKWVFTSEAGSRIPAVLYRPKNPSAKMPAIVLTFGHGGSKSQWQYNFGGQLYARMGLACLALDPIGEEERHATGRLGTRAHDPRSVSERADKAGRLVMGKLVFDTMRGIDFLMERDDIAHHRIGVAGNSLGGAKAGWMAALEPRIKMAIVSGWAYQDIALRTKYCTKLPNQRMRELISWSEYAALAAPDCAVKIMNGDADWVIDREDDQSAWRGMDTAVNQASSVYSTLHAPGKLQSWYEPDGGHRPYFAYKEALEWIHSHLGTPAMTLKQIRALPTINSGDFCDRHGIKLERLYGTPLHQRGATLPDFGIRPTPREKLSCLKTSELGHDDFTVEGWLKQIETTANTSR
jgi:predicted GH43/DUF377 family glycosyl hydrolase/poly(3-hydroxybutyrate) depolymerase